MSIETSAKAGHNVKALFKKIAMALPGGPDAQSSEANQSEPKSSASRCEVGSEADHDLAEIDVSSKSDVEIPQASGCQC